MLASNSKIGEIMKIFYDTEFIDTGKSIELISIGMVREDGQTLYMQNSEADLSLACDWVKENVISKLNDKFNSREEIAEAVKKFCLEGGKPEFWAYFGSYDWVALCQLYGRMMDLPKGFSYYSNELKQLSKQTGIEIEQPKLNHNALDDAIWARNTYLKLTE